MELKKAGIENFDAIYADMQKQFPAAELKSREAFEDLLNGGNYDLFIVLDGKDEIGYFTCYRVKASKMVLLDHFAVFEKCHGKGYGTKILPLIQAHYADQRGLILEIEQPTPAHPNTVRRVRFYKACGAYKLDMCYLLPGPNGVVTPMDLFFLNCGANREKVSPQDVVPALKEVFKVVFASFPNAESVWKLLEKDYSRGF